MKYLPLMNRDDFMNFFRDDEKLETLTNDDRVEVFLEILPGSSDITQELLEELMRDYCVEGVEPCTGKKCP